MTELTDLCGRAVHPPVSVAAVVQRDRVGAPQPWNHGNNRGQRSVSVVQSWAKVSIWVTTSRMASGSASGG